MQNTHVHTYAHLPGGVNDFVCSGMLEVIPIFGTAIGGLKPPSISWIDFQSDDGRSSMINLKEA